MNVEIQGKWSKFGQSRGRPSANSSGWADLNRRPLGPEPSALATAPQPECLGPEIHRESKKKPPGGFTGATGFEPAISGLTGRRDNQPSLRPQKQG
jgi:hypothetical protein